MHDVLEGCVQYEMKELIKNLIEAKVVKLTDINSEIEHFPYSYADVKNKPTVISPATIASSDHNIKQKGEFYGMYMLHR